LSNKKGDGSEAAEQPAEQPQLPSMMYQKLILSELEDGDG
jgi:hypothetical protein